MAVISMGKTMHPHTYQVRGHGHQTSAVFGAQHAGRKARPASAPVHAGAPAQNKLQQLADHSAQSIRVAQLRDIANGHVMRRHPSGPGQTAHAGSAGGVIQRQREWTGLDADRYREDGGKFFKFNSATRSWDDCDITAAHAYGSEAVSQYFGGIVRAEAPPPSLGEPIGYHITALSVQAQSRIPILQGIVGQWDTALARTGHALGTGAPEDRKNQYGDGIYAAKGSQGKYDYQHLSLPSIQYQVFKMNGIVFQSEEDEQQVCLTDPAQFIYVCFVEIGRLPSVQDSMPKKHTPPPFPGKEGDRRTDQDGRLSYSIF
jgi:hypothetical protein